ncbi:MAG: hypothetical protein ACP5KD_06030 [Fervidobacterium sp.]
MFRVRRIRIVNLILLSVFISMIISYECVFRIFENFSFGSVPEVFLVISSILLGTGNSLTDILIVSIASPILSFLSLQIFIFLYFRSFPTFPILLTVTAKGSVMFGLFSMMIIIIVGTISNVLTNKNGYK